MTPDTDRTALDEWCIIKGVKVTSHMRGTLRLSAGFLSVKESLPLNTTRLRSSYPWYDGKKGIEASVCNET